MRSRVQQAGSTFLLTRSSAVRVSGGLGSLALSMRAIAAVQLPWQSNSELTMPPLMMPGMRIAKIQ